VLSVDHSQDGSHDFWAKSGIDAPSGSIVSIGHRLSKTGPIEQTFDSLGYGQPQSIRSLGTVSAICNKSRVVMKRSAFRESRRPTVCLPTLNLQAKLLFLVSSLLHFNALEWVNV
jgi:hypothetical protein